MVFFFHIHAPTSQADIMHWTATGDTLEISAAFVTQVPAKHKRTTTPLTRKNPLAAVLAQCGQLELQHAFM